ncbi:M14 family zinc carboxypeptidase [Undibacterium sp. RTI2.1]|uniref:M14 family zinc carboxypeptidase n=1 Tax=unclassified Undibacterium TaxID=2630295 RepID=UPI002AB5B61B|nr:MULTISPECIES: M14 family zinc carboxypeptidase [unclassified Undibacterium]MDY7536868.1 M14 family zinc carboxypeptidase [Undibacterium sp. 5I1]MEB0029467.1 M14 family zinc carboxypeptidase [Undibacterium sp. RTI2.1]MEB0115653.1 M14 family zinc carboxypeptidase [Undibacterium sp. RTI2.2]MEB0230373.1 M14 family zinc carboxypeptidase [Undibacterium sp. 10I3]MEB0256750.1 M14 family zinc carboxypeptidase [Undibacterium sp. 5I1]
MSTDLQIPYELGNQNQTTTWDQCIGFYQKLASTFPHVLHFSQIGISDAGVPIHAGVVTADGVFDREQIKHEQRPVFFNNNGIHPGEPEGIDACMALVRDWCVMPERLAQLGRTAFIFIPIYNVDGCHNRQNTSRVNQDGPELFGFRGNSLHLDLNRDFIKCDSLNAQVFNQFFTAWDPDVMVDTHTSNGADYPYTMTLIHTQTDKLGGDLGQFLREQMLPVMFADMAQRGWPTCPYVNPVKESPDQGIEEFLETARFSTGYAALHHTIGFMPETHMLKPFADRYASMRALVEVALEFTIKHAEQIQQLRDAAKQQGKKRSHWPVKWRRDDEHVSTVRFKGYEACHKPSALGDYSRLYYDKHQAWEKDIPYFNHFKPEVVVPAPIAYVVPQQWRAAIERLQWNGVKIERIASDRIVQAQTYQIRSVTSRPHAYEGHLFHDDMELSTQTGTHQIKAGDIWITLDQDQARYAVETLEPQAHDSFFRWGFFNSVLEKKEAFSDYVFEDLAEELLREEPVLATQFATWKADHPQLLNDQNAVLSFIFAHCQRYAEPEWRRYPVLAIFA